MKFRHFTLADAPQIAALLNDEDISQWTSHIPFPYHERDAEEWINQQKNPSVRKPLAIEKDGVLTGCISCWSIDINTTEVGYWVGKPYWGQGIASEALSLFMQRADFPKTPRIIAKVVKQNLSSQRVLLKNGFDATDTCEVLRNGHTLDAVYFVKELPSKS